MIRKVPATVAWATTKGILSRMACDYGDPTYDDHDHALCVRDDESYIADVLLGVVHASVAGEENRALEAFMHFYDTLNREVHK